MNHSGDSDSTGSIAGNILADMFGEAALDPALVVDLELADVISQVADDLFAGFFGAAAGSEHEPMSAETEAFMARYPGG